MSPDVSGNPYRARDHSSRFDAMGRTVDMKIADQYPLTKGVVIVPIRDRDQRMKKNFLKD